MRDHKPKQGKGFSHPIKPGSEGAVITSIPMTATDPLASAGAAASATLAKASKGFVTEFGKGLVRGAKKEGARAGEDAVKWMRRAVLYGGSAAAGAEFGLPVLIAKYPAISEWLTRIGHLLLG